MDFKRIAPELSVLILLGLTAMVLSRMGPLTVRPELAVREELPDQIPGFETEEVLHCQNSSCLRPVVFKAEEPVESCGRCGGVLDPWSHGEHKLLPKDTGLTRKVYRNRSGRSFSVAIVNQI